MNYLYYISLYDSDSLWSYGNVQDYTAYEFTDQEALSLDGRYFTFLALYSDHAVKHLFVAGIVNDSSSIGQKKVASGARWLNGGELLVESSPSGGICALRMPMSFGGVVDVPGRLTTCTQLPAHIKCYDYSGSLLIDRQTFLGMNGRFSAGKSLDFGSYDVWVKPIGCLATRGNGCSIPMKTDAWTPFTCIPGDVIGDNKITAADVDALSNAFDTFEGDEGYLPDAELTGDHYVGTDDYLLVSQNQGKVGDN